MLDWLFVAVIAVFTAGPPSLFHWPAMVQGHGAVAFKPREREVTNWRSEAVGHLILPWPVVVQLSGGRDARQVTRCVRLNNYWCIKRAGWAGEIAADAEDHVAFASALEGADVAALLLHRYYIDYKRHSALAIISHWAPPSCGLPPSAGVVRPLAVRADHLAAHGLGNTLRARFLATRGRRGGRLAGRIGRMRRSVVPDRPIVQLRAPSIAVGLGEREVALPSALRLSAIAALGAAPSSAAAQPVTCGGDAARIRSYAERTAAGVAATVNDDLKLFAADGAPTANLARVMLNMSAVEIGPLGATPALVATAVEHLAARALPQPP